jgi:hypothetical protein
MSVVSSDDLDVIGDHASLENYFLNAPGLNNRYKRLYHGTGSSTSDLAGTYVECNVSEGDDKYKLRFGKTAKKIHLTIMDRNKHLIYAHSSNKYQFSILSNVEVRVLAGLIKKMEKEAALEQKKTS